MISPDIAVRFAMSHASRSVPLSRAPRQQERERGSRLQTLRRLSHRVQPPLRGPKVAKQAYPQLPPAVQPRSIAIADSPGREAQGARRDAPREVQIEREPLNAYHRPR